MKQWVVDVGLLAFGLIWIAGGIAFRDPSFLLARIACILFGGACVTIGLGSLIFGSPMTAIQFGGVERWHMAMMGCALLLFGSIGAANIAIYYPFNIPEWKGQAPWIGWVFFAGLLWFSSAGIVLLTNAWRQR